MAKIDKKVAFYQVSVLSQAKRRPASVDWRERLARVAALPMPERDHDGTVYDPKVTEGSAQVGVHALLKPDFMNSVDTEGATVTDLMDRSEELTGRRRLAHSTAMSFLDVGNVVAIATGTSQSPKPPKVLTDFLDRHVSLPAGDQWDAQPVPDPDKIEKFQNESRGAVAFSTRIQTIRSLFTPDSSDGLVKFADELADRIGGDIEITLDVRLAGHARQRGVMRKLADLIRGDLPRVASDPSSNTKVTALLDGDVQEELNLVAGRLAATIQVDTSVSESLRFSHLMDHLAHVSAEMEDTVRGLLEG